MEELADYLNDHLAGSVAAVELLDRLIAEKPSLEPFLRELRSEIEADGVTLKELMNRLGLEESPIRKAGAWILEKFSRVKMPLGKGPGGELGLFLAFESLALGINGKKLLWRALAAASKSAPELRGADYTRLERRAESQWDLVEVRRLQIAQKIFREDSEKLSA